MLYFIAAWGMLTLLTWMLGLLLLQLLGIEGSDRPSDRGIMALWLGTVILADGLLSLSLVWKLSPAVGGMVAVGIIGAAIGWKPVRTDIQDAWTSISLASKRLLGGWMVIIALYMARQVTWFDTGLYHFGAIRWLADYGAVPGLALLLSNLGFTSSWFALAAPLNAAGISSNVSAVTNGFVLLIATFQMLLVLHRCLIGTARLSDRFMLTFLGLVLPALTLTQVFQAVLVSPSPDIPIIFLTGVFAWTLLVEANRPTTTPHRHVRHHGDATLIPVILAAGTVAIKLSALPLLPIALLFYWGRPSNLSRGLKGGLVCLLCLAPVLAVSVVTSGCPLFPAAVLCANVPWRLDVARAIDVAEVIRGWNRWFGDPPAGTNPVFWLLWQWLKDARLNVVMLLLLVVSTLFSGFTLRWAHRQMANGVSWIFGLGFLGMGFILLRAPILRFGLGYFTLIPAIALALAASALWPQMNPPRTSGHPSRVMAQLSQIALYGVWGIGAIALMQPSVQARLLLPPPMPSVQLEVKQSHDLKYVSPVNNRFQCWDAPIPCTPGDKNIRLRKPNQGLQAGFIPAEAKQP